MGLVAALVLSAALAPPFYGPSTLGHTYRSAELPDAASCPAMLDYFGSCWYHPYPAVDWLLPVGTPVRAVAAGTVVLVGEETDADPDAWPRRPGRFLLLELDEPLGPCRVFAYKHLSRWATTAGARVDVGTVVAYSGRTQSPTAHLHTDCFTSLAGFNRYEAQAPFRVGWCDRHGRRRYGSPRSLRMGSTVWLSPCFGHGLQVSRRPG